MPSVAQRAVLVVAAVFAAAIVQVVPLVGGDGAILAYGPPATRMVETKPENRYFESVRPGYAMMAAEFVALGLATGFLFLALGRRVE